MGMIGIKLAEREFSAACAKIVRKYRDIAISDIKSLVLNGDHLMTCDNIDPEGIRSILDLHFELKNDDLNSMIYEDDEIATIELLNNRLDSYAETARQV